MTVSSQTNNATFVGNGVTTDFPLPFRFFSNSDVFAYFIDPTTGASTPMVLGTDYTLTGAGEPEVNGNAVSVLTTTAPLANLRGLYVERIMQEVQSTDIVNQGEFFASTHEDVFDRLTMLIQQANANSHGAIRVAIGDPEPQRLAPAARRANRLLGFDALGQPIDIAPVLGSATDLAINLENNTDPAKGAGMVGWSRSALIPAVSNVHRMLDAQAVNVWEFSHMITIKPSPDDPATWDWQPAFVAAFEASNCVRIPAGHYKHSGNIDLSNRYLIADSFSRNFASAAGGVLLEFTGAVGTPSFNIAGFCGMQGLTAIRSGPGKRGRIINIVAAVDRLSFFRDLRLSGASHCVYGSGFNVFSCLFSNIELGDFNSIGFYLNCTGATGSVFENIYASNWLVYPTTKNTAASVFVLEGNFTEAYIGQINCEHSAITDACIVLNGVEIANIISAHIEGIELSGGADIFKVIANASTGAKTFIRGVQADFNKCLGNDTHFISVTSGSSGPVYVNVEGFRSRSNDINGTSGHRFAIRDGSVNTNTPSIEASAVDSDLWSGNNFLPIASGTYKPILQRFNDETYYRRMGGVHYMPGLSAWPPANGVYPANAIVMNNILNGTSARGWHVWAAGNFAKPQNGTATYGTFSSTVNPDATAYAAYSIGDYIEMVGVVYRITNKFGGDTFLVTPNTPGTPQAGTPVLTAAPQYRNIT